MGGNPPLKRRGAGYKASRDERQRGLKLTGDKGYSCSHFILQTAQSVWKRMYLWVEKKWAVLSRQKLCNMLGFYMALPSCTYFP